MLQVVIRFLTLEVITEHPVVYIGLGAVWLILLLAAAFSILAQRISRPWKAFWFLLVFFLPILGLAIYALRCLFLGDWSFLKPLLVPPSPARKL
jgi:hypothetical protein